MVEGDLVGRRVDVFEVELKAAFREEGVYWNLIIIIWTWGHISVSTKSL